MTRDEANRLLEVSRSVRWRFPSSFGNPGAGEELVGQRDALVEAARLLLAEGDVGAATELAANVWRVWVLAGDVVGGRELLAPVLDAGDGRASRERALALYGDGLFALRQGAPDESRARNEAALEAAGDDPEALALAHLGLSRVACEVGDYGRGLTHAEAARGHASALGPAMSQGLLHLHAQSTRLGGDLDGAAALFEESLALNRRIGDQGMVAVELHNLGHVEIRRGNVDAAERYFTELGPSDDAYGDLNRAALAYGRGDHERARALVDRIETDFPVDDRAEFEWLRERLATGP